MNRWALIWMLVGGLAVFALCYWFYLEAQATLAGVLVR